MAPKSADRLAQLLRLAAARERDVGLWTERFAALCSKWGVRLSPAPEQQVSFAADAVPPLAAALRAGRRISISLGQCRELPGAVRELFAADAPDASRVVLSAALGSAALQELMALQASAPVGRSPRLAVLFGAPAEPASGPAWRQLCRRSYADPAVVPVPARAVRPLSPLHASEPGEIVLGAVLCPVARGTAWLTLELDARALLGPPAIRRVLQTCLRLADNLIDVLTWPQPELALDAALNRRVAVNLTHVGDRLAQQQIDPRSPAAFPQLRRWLMFVKRCFLHESARLARDRGPFPELRPGELVSRLAPVYGVADAERLVRNRCLRHRHLLMLSPLALLPVAARGWPVQHYINLLPVLSCADAIGMHGPDLRPALDLASWSRLLQLTGAIAADNAIRAPLGRH